MGIIIDTILETLDDSLVHPYKGIYGYFPKEYTRNSIQKSLKRLEKKGYIQKGLMEDEVCIQLTEIGIQEIQRRQRKRIENRLLNMNKDEKSWDKKWRVVVFDIPEENKRIRTVLRQTLRVLEFKPLQRSVWVSKNDYTKQLRKWIKDLKLSQYILVFETKSLN